MSPSFDFDLAAETRRITQAAAEARRRVEETRVTKTSTRRLFSLTVNGRGQLESFTFSDERYRAVPPKELASMITNVLRDAQQSAVEDATKAVDEFFPAPALGAHGGEFDDILRSMADRLDQAGLDLDAVTTMQQVAKGDR